MSKETIPVISLWQPWATACVTPHPNRFTGNDHKVPVKGWETRHWHTAVRGTVLIHASLKWTGELKKIYAAWPFSEYHTHIGELSFGCIVGAVDVIGCVTSDEWWREHFIQESEHWHEQLNMGNFNADRFAFPLQDPIKFATPLKMKGKQTPFWNMPLTDLPDEYLKIIRP